MTHSLYFIIELEEWEDVQELKEQFQESEEFLDLWNSKKNGDGQRGSGNQPFIWFPCKDSLEGGIYRVSIETGSHVSVDDMREALHWFYFTLCFMAEFSSTLRSAEAVTYYQVEGDSAHLSESKMLDMIRR
jgi:hypothetical protein